MRGERALNGDSRQWERLADAVSLDKVGCKHGLGAATKSRTEAFPPRDIRSQTLTLPRSLPRSRILRIDARRSSGARGTGLSGPRARTLAAP